MDKIPETEIQAPCGDIILHVGYCAEDKTILIRAGKGGSCRHQTWEVMAKLITLIPRKEAIEILRHYGCDSAKPGKSSCYDLLAKWLTKLEGK